MRVLFVSDTECKGGAAIAAARMAHALSGAGVELGMVVNDPQEGPPAGLWERFVVRSEAQAHWDAAPVPAFEAEVGDELTRVLDSFRPDAVSIHNIHGGGKVGWSVDMVRICAERVPTTWTLHDTWSFTGRCAYPGSCQRFLGQCGGECPTAGTYPFLAPDKIAGAFARKLEVLRNARFLAAVAPSRWMAACAAKGGWRGRTIRVIHNCLDTTVYRPINRIKARQELGLAPGERVALACAADFSDPRKGADLLAEALPRVGLGPLVLLLMGGGAGVPHMEGVTVRSLGFVRDAQRKALVYSAADVMIHPAREDNLPNTVLESLACGTPVAGFNIGGMADLVVRGETGALSATVDPQGLALAMETCLERSGSLSGQCRRHVAEKCGPENWSAQWMALIHGALLR